MPTGAAAIALTGLARRRGIDFLAKHTAELRNLFGTLTTDGYDETGMRWCWVKIPTTVIVFLSSIGGLSLVQQQFFPAFFRV